MPSNPPSPVMPASARTLARAACGVAITGVSLPRPTKVPHPTAPASRRDLMAVAAVAALVVSRKFKRSGGRTSLGRAQVLGPVGARGSSFGLIGSVPPVRAGRAKLPSPFRGGPPVSPGGLVGCWWWFCCLSRVSQQARAHPLRKAAPVVSFRVCPVGPFAAPAPVSPPASGQGHKRGLFRANASRQTLQPRRVLLPRFAPQPGTVCDKKPPALPSPRYAMGPTCVKGYEASGPLTHAPLAEEGRQQRDGSQCTHHIPPAKSVGIAHGLAAAHTFPYSHTGNCSTVRTPSDRARPARGSDATFGSDGGSPLTRTIGNERG